MAPKKTRKQKQKQRQNGGFRRVRVRMPAPIWNVRGVNMNFGRHIKEGELYGIDKKTGNYVILIEGKLVNVEAADVEFLNTAVGALNKTCATCGRNPQRLDERSLFEQSNILKKAKSGLHVRQNAYTIQAKNTPVLTYGLATCSALSMVIGKQRFLAHISADTDVMSMILAIVEVIKKEKVRPTEVKVWAGLGGSANDEEPILRNSPSFYSFENIRRILDVLQISIEDVPVEDTCFAEVVGL